MLRLNQVNTTIYQLLMMVLMLFTAFPAFSEDWYAGSWDSSLYPSVQMISDHPRTVAVRIEIRDKDTGMLISGAHVDLRGKWYEQMYRSGSVYLPEPDEREFLMRTVTPKEGIVVFALGWQKKYPWSMGEPKRIPSRRGGESWTYSTEPRMLPVDDLEKLEKIEIRHPKYKQHQISINFDHLVKTGYRAHSEHQSPEVRENFENAWRKEISLREIKYCILELGEGFSDFGNHSSSRSEFFKKIRDKEYGTVYTSVNSQLLYNSHSKNKDCGPYFVYNIEIELTRINNPIDVNIQSRNGTSNDYPERVHSLTTKSDQKLLQSDSPTGDTGIWDGEWGIEEESARKIIYRALELQYENNNRSKNFTTDEDINKEFAKIMDELSRTKFVILRLSSEQFVVKVISDKTEESIPATLSKDGKTLLIDTDETDVRVTGTLQGQGSMLVDIQGKDAHIDILIEGLVLRRSDSPTENTEIWDVLALSKDDLPEGYSFMMVEWINSIFKETGLEENPGFLNDSVISKMFNATDNIERVYFCGIVRKTEPFTEISYFVAECSSEEYAKGLEQDMSKSGINSSLFRLGNRVFFLESEYPDEWAGKLLVSIKQRLLDIPGLAESPKEGLKREQPDQNARKSEGNSTNKKQKGAWDIFALSEEELPEGFRFGFAGNSPYIDEITANPGFVNVESRLLVKGERLYAANAIGKGNMRIAVGLEDYRYDEHAQEAIGLYYFVYEFKSDAVASNFLSQSDFSDIPPWWCGGKMVWRQYVALIFMEYESGGSDVKIDGFPEGKAWIDKRLASMRESLSGIPNQSKEYAASFRADEVTQGTNMEVQVPYTYAMDFSTAPQWLSDSSQEFQWNQAEETFHGTQANGRGTSSYKHLQSFDPNASWQVDCDLKIIDCQWSAGLTFGIFDESLRYPNGAGVDLSIVDGGGHIGLWTTHNTPPGMKSTFQTGVWYHSQISYDALTKQLDLKVSSKSSGTVLARKSINVDSFPLDMQNIGVSRRHMKGVSSGVSRSAEVDYNLDNIQVISTSEIRKNNNRPASMGQSLDQTSHESKRSAALPKSEGKTIDLGGGVTLELVLIPPGEFDLGAPASDRMREVEGLQIRHVTIKKPFYISRYEVTQEQYEQVMGVNPSRHKGEKLPVHWVTFDDAQDFCKKAGFRLPTEIEWEYACRAGTSTRYFFGDGDSSDKLLTEYAWFWDNSDQKPHPCGLKKPNAWGLYDVYGNVSEWCDDIYPGRNPFIREAPFNTVKGGSWERSAVDCRSASFLMGPPRKVKQPFDKGIRVLLDLE